MRDEQTKEVYLSITSTVVLNRKQEMLYVPPLDLDKNLIVDSLVNSGASVSASAQNDLDTIKHKTLNFFLKIDNTPNYQIQVANGQLDQPLATTTPKFEFRDNIFAEHFVVIKKPTGPLLGSQFMRNNNIVIDTTNSLVRSPYLMMQVKTASIETTAKPQIVVTDDALAIPPRRTKTITAFVDRPSEWNTTATVTPLEKFTETASLSIFRSMSTSIGKIIAVRVTKTMESPYLINKNTQIAKFSVVTPEQTKGIKTVDIAILGMIPQGDPDLIKSKQTSQNEKTQATEQHFLVPNKWKSWKIWGSHPNTDTNVPKKLNW